MSNFIELHDTHGFGAMVEPIDSSIRGKWYGMNGYSRSRQRLATDAIGTYVLRLRNVAAGSRYRVERAGDGSVATPSGTAEGTAAGGDIDLTLDLYSPGNPNNDLRIKVRKGTAATKYLPFETLATAQEGTVIAYVAQVVDTIA